MTLNTTAQDKPLIQGTDFFKIISSLSLPEPKGILQVGSSYGQELDCFLAHRIHCGVFIEPLPDPFKALANRCSDIPGMIAVQTLCTAHSGERHTFHIASNAGQSSSILPPANHLAEFGWVKFDNTQEFISTSLDDVIAHLIKVGHTKVCARLDTLYMDTQGAELMVLAGATKILSQINYVYTEVTRNEMYLNSPSLIDLIDFLANNDFSINNINFNEHHHADALFIRNSLIGIR